MLGLISSNLSLYLSDYLNSLRVLVLDSGHGKYFLGKINNFVQDSPPICPSLGGLRAFQLILSEYQLMFPQ